MRLRELNIVWVDRTDPAIRVGSPLTVPGEAARVLTAILVHEPVEVFGVLCVCPRHTVLAYHEVSRGTLDSSIVHPREIFKPAVLTNAAAIVVGHNHPSGDPSPRDDDDLVTDRLLRAAEILGIPLLDHIIVGSADRFYSYRQSRGPSGSERHQLV